jgi:hypothetical protein
MSEIKKRKLLAAKANERRAYDLYLELGCEDDYDVAGWAAAKSKVRKFAHASASGAHRARPGVAGLHAASRTAAKATRRSPRTKVDSRR